MRFPITFPLGGPTACNHCAIYISAKRRNAPRGGSAASSPTIRSALHRRAFNERVPMRTSTHRDAQETYKCRLGLLGIGGGAGMAWATRAVHFSRCDTRQPDMRPLGAPDWAVTVPDSDGRTDESLSSGHDAGGKKKQCTQFCAPNGLRCGARMY